MAELMKYMHFNDDILTETIPSDSGQCVASGVANSDGDIPDIPIANIAMNAEPNVLDNAPDMHSIGDVTADSEPKVIGNGSGVKGNPF